MRGWGGGGGGGGRKAGVSSRKLQKRDQEHTGSVALSDLCGCNGVEGYHPSSKKIRSKCTVVYVMMLFKDESQIRSRRFHFSSTCQQTEESQMVLADHPPPFPPQKKTHIGMQALRFELHFFFTKTNEPERYATAQLVESWP